MVVGFRDVGLDVEGICDADMIDDGFGDVGLDVEGFCDVGSDVDGFGDVGLDDVIVTGLDVGRFVGRQ